MKLLTFNTHSLIDESYEKKIDVLASAIATYTPDVIALQEVMQSVGARVSSSEGLLTSNIPIKEDNFAFCVLKKLKNHKLNYHGAYLGIKYAYGAFDEGVSIITNKEAEETEIVQLTKFNDYKNWKTRFALGLKINGGWFYSLHFNWWNDEVSSFEDEWKTLQESIKGKKNVWLMGDFNITPYSDGYKLVTEKFYDTYMLASEIDNGITVGGRIDGWEKDNAKKRIDYIFTDKSVQIKSSKTIFNGKNEDIISDHFGVFVEKEQG